MKNRLTKGNAKVKNSLIWTIKELTTCLNNDTCKHSCYALKASKQYPNSKNFKLENLRLYKEQRNSLFASICNQIENSENIEVIRIHEAGDFFEQNYLDFWATIAQFQPNKKFWSYTKVKDKFDFSNLPENLNIIDSFISCNVICFMVLVY